jgi:hypothetical protein
MAASRVDETKKSLKHPEKLLATRLKRRMGLLGVNPLTLALAEYVMRLATRHTQASKELRRSLLHQISPPT